MNKLILSFLIAIITLNSYSNNYVLNSSLKNNFVFENNPNIILKNNSINKDTTSFNLPKNSIYLELLGFGIYYSINYERVLFENKNNIITGRIGFFEISSSSSGTIIIIPALINYQTNINRTISFEIGFGYRFINSSIVANAGFRFLIKNKFLFKVNFTPQFYGFEGKSNTLYIGKYIYGFGINPYAGISFGYSFGKK